MVDVEFVKKFKKPILLRELQEYKDFKLKEMQLIKRNRLSVQRVTKEEYQFILGLEMAFKMGMDEGKNPQLPIHAPSP
jgi:predicted RNA-binding protein with PUA-like domain